MNRRFFGKTKAVGAGFPMKRGFRSKVKARDELGARRTNRYVERSVTECNAEIARKSRFKG